MKLKALTIAALFIAISIPVLSAPNAKTSFESLKSLAGQWDAKDPSGKQQTITWKVVSAGSVLMESMQEESMVTMYHVDNNRLMLTHYARRTTSPAWRPRYRMTVKPLRSTLSMAPISPALTMAHAQAGPDNPGHRPFH
jgi:hypothetical protein